MLKAAGIPLSKQILAHGWWQKDGAKISKSTGSIVDPIAVIDDMGPRCVPLLLCCANWTSAPMAIGLTPVSARYQTELANGLGNREPLASMLKRYRNGVLTLPSMISPPLPRKP